MAMIVSPISRDIICQRYVLDDSQLSETFDLLDVDKDGRLSRNEIAALLRIINVEPTRVELDFIFQEMDMDQEFITYMRSPPVHRTTLKEIEKQFKNFDSDGDGAITEEEMAGILRATTDLTDAKAIHEMFKATDLNGDGRITFFEFVKNDARKGASPSSEPVCLPHKMICSTVVSSLQNLPAEVLVEILSRLNPHDVPNLRSVNKMINNVILNNYKYLPRIAYVLNISLDDGVPMIHIRKSGSISGISEKYCEFDFSRLEEIDIVEVEVFDMNSEKSEQSMLVLKSFMHFFTVSRQNSVRSVTFKNVNLDSSFNEVLYTFNHLVTSNSEKIIVIDSQLPSLLDSDQISSFAFEHYKCIGSAVGEETQTICDLVLRKFTQEMTTATTKLSFLAEFNSVSVGKICDFIETWLSCSIAPYFNICLHDCDEDWKTHFLAACYQRRLSHNNLEFPSLKNETAHIKVSFSMETKMCCFWPIFDVPARAMGQNSCYSRYYRDF
ncbi:unnamed protein product [Caenorhabditis auriculariae]|uniref:F-box domain-containing protein n=1 Tax=Caenorhabditis auriculariae TaxID=2777116 RepID=A0A8S1GNI3_9PELO|nr:unnamed protein product [Caenorhabditis auriculariae]